MSRHGKPTLNQRVPGSSPGAPTNLSNNLADGGRGLSLAIAARRVPPGKRDCNKLVDGYQGGVRTCSFLRATARPAAASTNSATHSREPEVCNRKPRSKKKKAPAMQGLASSSQCFSVMTADRIAAELGGIGLRLDGYSPRGLLRTASCCRWCRRLCTDCNRRRQHACTGSSH